jgi:hypothetical protein
MLGLQTLGHKDSAERAEVKLGRQDSTTPVGNRVGARVVSRLSSGVPTDRAIIDNLEPRWRALADELERAQPEARRSILRRHLDSWEDGRAMLAAILQANPTEDPLAEPVQETVRQRFALRSVADIKAMPPLHWQIDNHIPKGSLVVEFGQSGSGKTFEAFEEACCIAGDRPWHGLESVEPGIVVYVAAEGSGGLNKRLAAWERQHPGADLSRLFFITEPVNLLDAVAVEAFKSVLRSLPERPAAVFLDTLARCLVGGDENSAKDMGLAIAAVDSIRAEFDATVYVIHHCGKNSEAERGSSALRAAADVMIQVTSDNENVTLTCSKMKDAEPFKKLHLTITPVEGTDSCVLEWADRADDDTINVNDLKVLRTLERHFPRDEGASSTTWQELAEADGGVPRRTFFRSKKKLLEAGYVSSAGSRAPCLITDSGRQLLAGQAICANAVPTLKVPRWDDDEPSVTSRECQGANLVPNGAVAPSPADGAVGAKVPHSFRSGTNGTNGDGGPPRLSGGKKNGVVETVNAALDEPEELP